MAKLTAAEWMSMSTEIKAKFIQVFLEDPPLDEVTVQARWTNLVEKEAFLNRYLVGAGWEAMDETQKQSFFDGCLQRGQAMGLIASLMYRQDSDAIRQISLRDEKRWEALTDEERLAYLGSYLPLFGFDNDHWD